MCDILADDLFIRRGVSGLRRKVRAHTDNQTLTNSADADNGAKKIKRPRRRNPETPQLSEKAKKLALKAFRMTYEAHHGKNS